MMLIAFVKFEDGSFWAMMRFLDKNFIKHLVY